MTCIAGHKNSTRPTFQVVFDTGR